VNAEGWSYFFNVQNMIDFFNWISVFMTILSGVMASGEPDLEKSEELRKDYRTIQILGMILQSVMMLNQVKIVEFFSAFVREFIEITKDSLPLAAMLTGVIFVQAVCFYIMSENVEGDKVYDGIWVALIDSYRLALGDFEITSNFENTTTPVQFWLLFLLGSIISLLILLNMVIAVMGSSFERVQEENTAQIYREKLRIMVGNAGSYPTYYTDQLVKCKYLFKIEVDPELKIETQQASEPQDLASAYDKELLKRVSDFEGSVRQLSQSHREIQDALSRISKDVGGVLSSVTGNKELNNESQIFTTLA